MAALQWARATNLQRSSSRCRDSTSGVSGSQTGPAGCSVTRYSSWSFCGSNGTQMWCGGHWPRVPGLCPHGERGKMPCSMGTANLAHTRCASIPPAPCMCTPTAPCFGDIPSFGVAARPVMSSLEILGTWLNASLPRKTTSGQRMMAYSPKSTADLLSLPLLPDIF